MSTNLLYHGFGLRFVAMSMFAPGMKAAVTFTIRHGSQELSCPVCGSGRVVRRGVVWRRFKSLPIGSTPVWIMLAIQRASCLVYGLVCPGKVGFADHRRTYTKAFERYGLELSRHMTILDAARRLRSSKAKVEAVVMDMSPAYIDAVMENLPQATIVFDHFHIIKLFNDGLSDLWRQIYRKAEIMEKKVIKGTRWLLLKNPENLDVKRDEPYRLQEALALNQPLATSYYLKEDLRQLWKQPHKQAAKIFLLDWVFLAGSSGIAMLRKFARTLAAHRTGILACYDYPLSTAPLEGTNNKINTMKRQALGFRDLDFFKLKIMAIHETKHALAG